jgi:hypothetical protein
VIISALDFFSPQEKLLSSSCYDVFFIAVLECIIEGLFKLRNRLNWTHRANAFLLLLLNFTTIYQ